MATVYSDRQIREILRKIIAKAQRELMIASENGTIDELLEDYGITFEESAMPVNPRTSRILVVGSLAGKQKDYEMSARKYGIPSSNIEFLSDYEKLSNNDLTRLEYSNEYSDIIFGPVPHSMAGKGDASSIIVKMEREAEKYPRVIRANAGNELKLSVSSFRKAIKSTRYFETMD